VAAVASDLITESVEAAVRELRRRLATTKEIEARSLLLRNQQQTARADLTKAAGRRDGAEAALGSLRAAIGGESDNAIAERIALAASRSAAEAKLREVEAKLLEIGDGWPIDALERESTVLPAAHLETELARLQLETERITRDRETAAGEEQRLLNDVQRMEEAETAIDAAERRQAAIAATARISAEALTYHAAACLLRLGLESLKGSADGGLVQRLGATFARITGDAYAGVAADEDGAGIPFLVAIEADGTTAKRVGELSEGTRDQLFLALRLVMLEDYASKAPALPFIADDLLQTFDDYNRTAHALAALVDLSHHMQVIVLSHHRHLLQVTEALPAGTVNVCDLAA
jgi:uncharacterized protein YhaN